MNLLIRISIATVAVWTIAASASAQAAAPASPSTGAVDIANMTPAHFQPATWKRIHEAFLSRSTIRAGVELTDYTNTIFAWPGEVNKIVKLQAAVVGSLKEEEKKAEPSPTRIATLRKQIEQCENKLGDLLHKRKSIRTELDQFKKTMKANGLRLRTEEQRHSSRDNRKIVQERLAMLGAGAQEADYLLKVVNKSFDVYLDDVLAPLAEARAPFSTAEGRAALELRRKQDAKESFERRSALATAQLSTDARTTGAEIAAAIRQREYELKETKLLESKRKEAEHAARMEEARARVERERAERVRREFAETERFEAETAEKRAEAEAMAKAEEAARRTEELEKKRLERERVKREADVVVAAADATAPAAGADGERNALVLWHVDVDHPQWKADLADLNEDDRTAVKRAVDEDLKVFGIHLRKDRSSRIKHHETIRELHPGGTAHNRLRPLYGQVPGGFVMLAIAPEVERGEREFFGKVIRAEKALAAIVDGTASSSSSSLSAASASSS